MGTVQLRSSIVNDSSKIKQKYVNKFKALLYMAELEKATTVVADADANANANAVAVAASNHLTIRPKYMYIVHCTVFSMSKQNRQKPRIF